MGKVYPIKKRSHFAVSYTKMNDTLRDLALKVKNKKASFSETKEFLLSVQKELSELRATVKRMPKKQ